MKELIFWKYPQNYWEVAEYLIIKDGEVMEWGHINKFWELSVEDPRAILIYATSGGSGYGYSKDRLLRKLIIEDYKFNDEPNCKNAEEYIKTILGKSDQEFYKIYLKHEHFS